MASKAGDELLAVARIGAPRGLGGFLKLHSYSGEYAHLKKMKTALVAPEKRPDLAKEYDIRAVQTGEWGMSAAFTGYDSPETARVLVGMEIFAPRSKASPLKPDEWYIHDLVGLSVLVDGVKTATVVGVLDGGADPLLEAQPEKGGAAVLIPFRKEFVGKIECEAGTLELLAGWLLE